MRNYFLFGFFSLGLGLAGACNNDPEAVNRTQASPSVRELLEEVCSVSLRCCSRGEVDYFHGPYVDAENCAERLFDQTSRSALGGVLLSELDDFGTGGVLVPNLGALDQAVQEGRTTVDLAALEVCKEHLGGLGCNEPLEEEDEEVTGCQPPPPPAEENPCDARKLFVGRLGAGSVCTSTGSTSFECAPGLVCVGGYGLGVTGRCIDAQQEGGLCSANYECDEGLYCSELDGSCTRPRKEGDVCVFADRNDPAPAPETLLVRCEDHLSCDPITNTCVASCQAGASCTTDEDCDEEQELTCIMGRCGLPRGLGLPCADTPTESHCQDGYFCGPDRLDPTQRVCTEKKADAATCAGHEECESGFCPTDTYRCTATVPVGDPCPSQFNEQCNGGRCVVEAAPASPGYCIASSDCPNSGTCDTLSGSCGNYCVAVRPDGATCSLDEECESGDCIAGSCRTGPLALGVRCDTALDCESEFCSYDDERVCVELPLPLNSPCFASSECDSGVCFSATAGEPTSCVTGSGEGEACGQTNQAPCNPKQFYCDFEEEDPPVCVKLKETGEACKGPVECRGDCTVRHGRQMCSAAAPEDEAVCGGADPVALPEAPAAAAAR